MLHIQPHPCLSWRVSSTIATWRKLKKTPMTGFLIWMLGLIKNLKNKLNLQVQHLHSNNAGKNKAFKRICNQQGLGINSPRNASTKWACWMQSLGRSCEHCHTFQEQPSHLTRKLSPFQQYFRKGKRNVPTLMQNLVKCASLPTRTTPIGLY